MKYTREQYKHAIKKHFDNKTLWFLLQMLTRDSVIMDNNYIIQIPAKIHHNNVEYNSPFGNIPVNRTGKEHQFTSKLLNSKPPR